MTSKTQAARPPRFGFDANSPLGRFWRWWSGELAGLVPQCLRRSSAGVAGALLIEVTPQAIVLRRWLEDKPVELGRIDLLSGDHAAHGIAFQTLFAKQHGRGENAALWLPETQFLIRQIELPLAAAENLRQVLGFEMDRLTPFKADRVYSDFRLVQRDAQKNRLTVRLAVALRHPLDEQLDLLARWGVPVRAAYAPDTMPGAEPFDLMPDSRRIATQAGWLNAGNLALLALALVLASAALLIPVWQKRQASIALIPVVEQAKQQAMAADALRREQEGLAAEYNFVLAKKQELPPLVAVLDELSRLLPDDTWVQQFSLKNGELHIQGETASSSRLIGLIESSGMLHEANFRSPLTKGSAAGSERYQLVAKVRPLVAAAHLTAVSAVPGVGPVKADDTSKEAAQAVAQSAVPAVAQKAGRVQPQTRARPAQGRHDAKARPPEARKRNAADAGGADRADGEKRSNGKAEKKGQIRSRMVAPAASAASAPAATGTIPPSGENP